MKKGTKTLVILIVVLAVILGGGYLAYRAVGPEKLAALRPPAGAGRPGNPGPAGEGEKFAAPVAVHTVQSGPARDTLAWYRLACFLPNSPRPGANLSASAADRQQALADYRMVLGDLGNCPRTRG